MYKKEEEGASRSDKKGQITIFIIVGLLMLFAFFFIISLAGSLKKGQLGEAQEKTLTKLFKKEALRIFVEDCLTDQLEKGLLSIGKQGRLWSDQPGGTKSFQEGLTGVTYNPGEEGGRVLYAITKENYIAAENAYPCNNESYSPEFCRYMYPDTTTGFGDRNLQFSTLENDLRRFLIDRTTWCVEDFTKNNISSNADVEAEQIDLTMNILDDGIDVKVDYPLKLRLGKEEFFHLSTFDFFYPTKFKALLDAAVIFPLRMDWKYVDFNYTQEIVSRPSFQHGNEVPVAGCVPAKDGVKSYFLCNLTLLSDTYSSLGLTMEKQILERGDELFIFTAPPYAIINSPEEYKYRFVRQNRPPALDYVSRLACTQARYDYLVLKGDTSELGLIDITLDAKDADEDLVSYRFSGNLGQKNDENFHLPVEIFTNAESGVYTITAHAVDEHGLEDRQDVRVLVDRPIELNLVVDMPYRFLGEEGLVSYPGIFTKNDYVVSTEDPVFLRLTYSGTSVADLSKTLVSLKYSNKDNDENFELGILKLPSSTTESCFSFPWSLSKTCDISDYAGFISQWKDELSSKAIGEGHTSYFKEPTTSGLLNLSISTEYCSSFGSTDSAEAKVVVADCVPHRNPQHPFAFPYHGYVYDSFDFETQAGECVKDENDRCVTEENFKPFEATHSCCVGGANPATWKLKEEGATCFINPEKGCYGKIVDTTANYGLAGPDQFRGYVLEQQVGTCDGTRGNTCEGPRQYSLWQDKLICGDNDLTGCQEIDSKCENTPSWEIVEGEGWCHGKMGCTNFCDTAVVYTGQSTSKAFNINAEAKTKKIIEDEDFQFQCGCAGAPEGSSCDGNFDGLFDGHCSGNGCVGG